MRIVNTAFVLALASSASAKLNNPDENRDLQFDGFGDLMGNVSMPEMPDMGDLMGNVSMPEMPDMEGIMNATADMAESAIALAQEAAASAQEAIANATAGMMEGAVEEPGSAANVKLMITSASVVSVAVLLNAL